MANRGGSRMSSKAPLAPDRSVVTEIAQGDIEALGELMRRHGRTVYALAYSILVDPGEADDVVGFARVDEDAVGKGIHRPPMPSHELSQGLDVSLGDLGNHAPVGR